MDEDDQESQDIYFEFLSIRKVIGAPGRPMGLMMRQCYEASTGRYVMLLNDDVLFRTPQWDCTVERAFAQFPDEIALVYGDDLDQGDHVPTFPIISRAACEAIGSICPAGYLNLHIESHLLDIFKQLKKLGPNRIVYLPDVVFEHLHHSVGKSQQDSTSRKRDPRSDERLFIALDDERYRIAVRLAQWITGGHNTALSLSPVGTEDRHER